MNKKNISDIIEKELKNVIDESKKEELSPSEIIEKYTKRIIKDIKEILDFKNVRR